MPHQTLGTINKNQLHDRVQASSDKYSICRNQTDARAELEFGKSAINEVIDFWNGAHNGMHELVDETAQSLNVAREYYGNALNGKINAGADALDFGKAIVEDTGSALQTAADYYLHKVPNGRADFIKDLSATEHAISATWNSMSSLEKGHFVGKQVVPCLLPAAVGAVSKEVQVSSLLARAGETLAGITSVERAAVLEEKILQLNLHVKKMKEPLESAKGWRGIEEKLSHAGAAGGEWQILNERASAEVVKQAHPNACASAAGEMLTNGAVKQEHLIKELAKYWHPLQLAKMKYPTADLRWLAKELGDAFKFIDAAEVGDSAVLDSLLKKGTPWITELKEEGKIAHAIVVDGIDECGLIKIRDPFDATRYEMCKEEFQKFWTRRLVMKQGD